MQPHMIDQLLQSAEAPSLDALERDVWARLAEREQADRAFAQIAGAQLVLAFVVAVGSAIGGGMLGSRALAETPALGVFSPHAVLAPSSRLLGHG